MIDLEFRKQSARLNRCPRPLPEIGDSVLLSLTTWLAKHSVVIARPVRVSRNLTAKKDKKDRSSRIARRVGALLALMALSWSRPTICGEIRAIGRRSQKWISISTIASI